MSTGERIKQLRTSLGMSQEELGEKIGVKKAAIHKYETGIVVNLKRSVIDDLARALHTTPAYLMEWDENDESTEPETNYITIMSKNGNNMKIPVPQEKIEQFRLLVKAILPEIMDDEKYKDL